ncbi:MAG TPA: TIGR00645 family protein [Thermodesulfovibrionia bacterium]|nr:TIGR00645 family protein [Thermodesulfovibrionia bacterium]
MKKISVFFAVIERFLEMMMFNSRWLLTPFYVGLVLAIVLLLFKFLHELIHAIPLVFVQSESALVMSILSLVDLSLVANLLLIIIFSGYENFVSKINVEGHEDRPEWMGKVDFSGLKLKLIASMVAISGIELLKSFVNIEAISKENLFWKIIIHATLVVSGLLFALMDRIAEGTLHEKDNK